MGELALAVGERLRNAVEQDFDAPNGERRARTGTTDRDALVEREVVAVRHEDARYAAERLVEPPGRASGEGTLVHDGDGEGQTREGQLGPRDGDHHGGEGIDPSRVALLGGGLGCGARPGQSDAAYRTHAFWL